MDKQASKRFDYIVFDESRTQMLEILRDRYKRVEVALDALKDGRAKSLALTKLEESFSWVGKALRDEQLDPETGEE